MQVLKLFITSDPC